MANQHLLLQLVRVKCGDETGGQYIEQFGKDEFYLSAVGVDAAYGVQRMDPIEIDSNFADGKIKEFSPPRTLLALNVPDGGRFPKTCVVYLIGCERYDGKGHQEATTTAFAKAKEQAALASVPAADGGWSVVVTVAIPIIVAAVKERVAQHFKDKVFEVQPISLEVASADFRWGDGTKLSPETTVRFAGYEGTYYLVYYWEIQNA
jgi:hypothetical protein